MSLDKSKQFLELAIHAASSDKKADSSVIQSLRSSLQIVNDAINKRHIKKEKKQNQLERWQETLKKHRENNSRFADVDALRRQLKQITALENELLEKIDPNTGGDRNF